MYNFVHKFVFCMSTKNAVGIDIGGTNLRVALVSENGNVQRRVQYTSDKDIVVHITEAIDELKDNSTAGIGLAVAGIIDRRKNTVLFSPNLRSIEKLDLIAILKEKYSLPIFIDNDANCAALGEKYVGKGKNLDSFILMTLGTGIGGGILHGGRLLDIPAELGHMTVDPAGPQCTCGNYGCLEELAAAKAIKTMAVKALERGEDSSLTGHREENMYKINPKTVYEYARAGDRLSKEILRTAGKYLGVAIANLTNIFYPQAFILTGGLTNAWEMYIEEAIKEADKRSMHSLFDKEMVMLSDIKEDAGMIGAALHTLSNS